MRKFTKISLSLVVANTLFLASTHAQYLDRLIDKTTNRVERKIENNINRKVDKAVDNTERSLEKGVKNQVNKAKDKNSKDKTSTTTNNSSKTTATIAATATGAAIIDSEKASDFIGVFQWEVKEYKSDKLVANGHYIIDFFVKEFDIAAHILHPTTKARQNAYVLHREKGTVAILDDAKKTATVKASKGIANYLLAFRNTDEYEKVNGVSCVKYTAEEGDIQLTLWVDDSQRVPHLYSLKNGIGTIDKKFQVLPYIAHLKTPAYKVVFENKKLNERVEINLQNLESKTPKSSAFD